MNNEDIDFDIYESMLEEDHIKDKEERKMKEDELKVFESLLKRYPQARSDTVFNYRGGNIEKITDYLKTQGISLSKENRKEHGIGSAIFTDINGRVFYFDTSNDEERIDILETEKKNFRIDEEI